MYDVAEAASSHVLFFLFFFVVRRTGKITLKLTTLTRSFIHVVCQLTQLCSQSSASWRILQLSQAHHQTCDSLVVVVFLQSLGRSRPAELWTTPGLFQAPTSCCIRTLQTYPGWFPFFFFFRSLHNCCAGDRHPCRFLSSASPRSNHCLT